jgi:hypothetical protein
MNTSDLELRLERLERRLNRYRLTSLLLGLGVIGLAGIAANAPSTVTPEVRTHKLVVVNEAGKEAAHILASQHGGLLTLLNYEDLPVVRLGVGEKGGKLTINNPKGASYIVMSSEDNGGELLLQDQKGQKHLMRATGAAAQK